MHQKGEYWVPLAIVHWCYIDFYRTAVDNNLHIHVHHRYPLLLPGNASWFVFVDFSGRAPPYIVFSV